MARQPKVTASKLDKVLVANRGEIACRIFTTLHRLGIRSVAVYAAPDSAARHVQLAHEKYLLPGTRLADNYLSIDAILAVARQAKVTAIHPGYGFLAENAEFAEQVTKAGIIFIGPTAEIIAKMADKAQAKELMTAAKVPVLPGYNGEKQSSKELLSAAQQIGYPLLIKPCYGGGGKGMRVVLQHADCKELIAAAKREAQASFGNDKVILEKYIAAPRHVEVQIIADNYGKVIHCLDRDCSVQRRYQKVIEEAPIAGIPILVRKKLTKAAVAAASAINYRNIGTVEFLFDSSNNKFYFMEMNTRLQVEHPVTEAITGIDLVEWQLKLSAGEKLSIAQKDVICNGHAIEARICAEDPENNYLPATGKILDILHGPAENGVRLDLGINKLDNISIYYDSLLAKLIVWGPNRSAAIDSLQQHLANMHLPGIVNNIAFLRKLVNLPDYVNNHISTSLIQDHLKSLTGKLAAQLPVLLGVASYLYWVTTAFKQQTASPWEYCSGWRLQHANVFSLQLVVNQQRYRVKLLQDNSIVEVFTNNQRVAKLAKLNFITKSSFNISIDNKQYAGTFIGYGVQFYLSLGGVDINCGLNVTEEYDLALQDNQDFAAPMAGTITKVCASKGKKVGAGMPIIIMEAMKMEHIIRAPYDGIVQEIYFKPEDTVQAAEILLAMTKEQ